MYIKRISYLRFLCRMIIVFLIAVVVVCFSLFISGLIFGAFYILKLSNSFSDAFLISLTTEIVSGTALFFIPNSRDKIKALYRNLGKEFYLYTLKINNSFLRNLLISVYNEDDLEKTEQQEEIAMTVLDILNKNEPGMIWIEGFSECGKTSSVYLLFDMMGRNNSEKEKRAFISLDRKSVYIDCTLGQKEFDLFLDLYKQGKFSEQNVFIDNIASLPESAQSKLYKFILRPYINYNELRSKLMVLFLNKDNWFVSDVKYDFEVAKKTGTLKHFNLDDSLNDYLEINIEQNNFNLTDENWNMLKLWLFRVQNYIDKPEDIKRLLNGTFNDFYDEAVFFSIIISCRFVNYFSEKETKQFLNKVILVKRYNKIFKRLYKKRIIVRFPFLEKYYSFNRNTAKYFRKILNNQSLYKKLQVVYFNNIGKKGNTVLKWLSFIDLNFDNLMIESQEELFRESFDNGNYQYMLDELNFVCELDARKKTFFCRELGYLNEKTGNRNDAIKYLKEYLSIEKDNEKRFIAELLLFEVNHHYSFDTSRLKVMRSQSANAFTVFQSKYWMAHIDIEQGRFYIENFISLLDEIEYEHSFSKENNYYHILRRMYSDLARIYSLKGDINIKLFSEIKKRMNNSKLKTHHPEFNIHFQQIISAQYIQYDILFQRGFYGKFRWETEFSEGLNSNDDPEKYASKAVELYLQCEIAFRNNGDKAWKTAQVRRHETELAIQSSDKIKIKSYLDYYREECKHGDNSVHLTFINSILVKWHVVTEYLKIGTKGFMECIKLLDEIRSVCKVCENVYGIFRADFMQAFLELMNDLSNRDKSFEIKYIEKKFRNTLSDLKPANSYNREYEMINYILEQKQISADLILRFFTYYPIVLQ